MGTELDWVKIYGPLAVAWPVAMYLGMRLLNLLTDHMAKDTEAKIQMTTALVALTRSIEDRNDMFERIERVLNTQGRT